MKFLNSYKLFESNDDDIRLLFSSINDDEFKLDVRNNVVSITKKRTSGMTVLKSIFDEDDRHEINSIIDQVLSIGDYVLDGEIEYQQKMSSVLTNPTSGKTVLTGKVTDIDMKSFMSEHALDQTEFLIKTKGLPSFRWSITQKEMTRNEKTNTPILVNTKQSFRELGGGTRKMTLLERDNTTDYYSFFYKRKGDYSRLGTFISEYDRYSIEYVLILKSEVNNDLIKPSIYKVKLKLTTQ